MKLLPRQYFSHYIKPRLMAYGGKYLLKLLALTCRIEIEGLEEFKKHGGTGNCILLLWHNRLMLVAPVFQRCDPTFTYTAFISQSRDGEPLAIFTESHKNGRCIRVRHQAKHEALKEMIHRLKNSPDILLITPDGPRGPRYRVKEGVALAAKETGAKIFPFSWSANAFWQLGSWDKMIIPKPFSTIKAIIGTPIVLTENDSLEGHSEILENAMLHADAQAESFFKTKPK